ncbi:1-acyl-sn-glycerol-3-phosphate acyltransferase [Carboxylicivirga sediminis]|uniref:1-acyl-sn-glycerol-3-phosphate acyltransferase n=1 Tax=Carboxylicivirga sediminis TaxID=2006564 RepID=A0A941F5P8_9BACT|nr:1-acyl-sn-glycerol-3-phosphate acyltransferase [Carboxylicivirga sediminis]MBR8536904.1 1-acyl-sn-glycerol-3-phosphate acyltransferase [Carboxylicivirga sediminis]
MVNELNFDSIRPYNDDEIHEVFERLVNEVNFLGLINFLYPNFSTKDFLNKLLSIQSIKEFQTEVIYPYVKEVLRTTTKGITHSGFENLDPKGHYLFISNHRDIVLDSAILNILMVENGFNTTEIAIGDNLLIYPWITDLVKLNKSFIVQRNLPVRQMMESTKRLSSYIRQTLTERNQSIWIAQREGRSKDGDDRTQVSLLKMLNMSGNGSFSNNFEEINIVPLSISYEYDPCDYLKAHEFLMKRDNPDFKKTQDDDLKHMGAGLRGRKGRVHFGFGSPIKKELSELEALAKNDQLQALAELIDNQIHSNYKFYPGNFIADDLFTNHQRHINKYTDEDKSTFLAYLDEHLSRIDGDKDFLFNTLLEMYANPVKNFYTCEDK